MIIGIAGLPELTHNYTEAIYAAADCVFSPSSAPPAASPFLRHIQKQQRHSTPEIEVSLSPDRAARWDALVLPGGGDIDPLLLPGKPPLDPHCHNVDPILDRRQLALLDFFVQKKKPVLGICKGMQLICLYFGGSLIQHLASAETHRYKECDQFHPTHAVCGSFLFHLYGGYFTVNSAHHQGICVPEEIPLSVIQTADDGVPEGLVHQTLPIIGLQWHPERLCKAFLEHPASQGALPAGFGTPPIADGGLIFRYFLGIFH